MRFIKDNERTQKKYFVPEIAQAIGVSEGAIRGYVVTKLKKSVKDGLTIDEIVRVLERPRTRGDGIDFGAVAEIRDRLINERGYRWEAENTNEAAWFEQMEVQV